MTRKPVILVVGPTASGKSTLALVLAEKFGGTIINADSMQVYKDLQILTARPNKTALNLAPHKLYGFLSIDQRCSAGRWRRLALSSISAAHDDDRLPIVVGGTGLYLRALTEGLHALPEVPLNIRKELNERTRADGIGKLYNELVQSDPETAAMLNPNDRQRIIRAMEVLLHSGKGLSKWRQGATDTNTEKLRFFSIQMTPPRDSLYEIINARFEKMLQEGAIDEVQTLIRLKPPDDPPLMKAVGVPPIIAYLNKEIDHSRLLELGKGDTRRYAKRQLSWFRNKNISNLEIKTKYSEIIRPEIFSEISKFLLTK